MIRIAWLPIAGGLALGASASGACASLVGLPPAALVAFGCISIAIAALSTHTARSLVLAALAFGVGCTLAGQAPTSFDVVSSGRSSRGLPADMFAVLDQLDRSPNTVLGRRVVVSGEWSPTSHGHAASVSTRVMACCAADAIHVGFDLVADHEPVFNSGAVVCVGGVLRSALRDGELRYVITHARIGKGRC